MPQEETFERFLQRGFEQLASRIDKWLQATEQGARFGADDFHDRVDKARQKLGELSISGQAAWRELKPGLEKSWLDLSESFRKAVAEFQKAQGRTQDATGTRSGQSTEETPESPA